MDLETSSGHSLWLELGIGKQVMIGKNEWTDWLMNQDMERGCVIPNDEKAK